MKLKLVFESSPLYGNCLRCPAYTIVQAEGWCADLSENIYDHQSSKRCKAVLDQSDEIRAGEIAALKAEIVRLQALVRGEV